MDSGNKKGGSTSPFPSELFGTKEPSPNDVFASIFPPQKGMGRNSGCSESAGSSWQSQPSSGNTKPDNMDKNRVGNKGRTSIYQEEGAAPCSLSSSLYYGGQEIYSQPPPSSHHASGSHHTYKKDAGEDDPSSASRGNWWQGSLYY